MPDQSPPGAARPQGGPPPAPAPLPPAEPPPADVAAAAAAENLGAHLGTRSWGRPRDAWLMALVPVVLWVAAIAITIAVNGVFPLAAIFLVWTVTSVARAIALTRRGGETTYLFAGGIVRKDKRGLLAVPWTRAARLGKSDRNRGLTGGRRFPLYLADGGVIEIPYRPAGGVDAYVQNVSAIMRHNGLPVS